MVDKFTCFRSYHEATKELPADVYQESWLAIMNYVFEGIVPDDLSPIANAIFCLTKPNIDKSLSRAEAGSKGGRSKPETNDKQTSSKVQANLKQTASKLEANEKNVQAIKDKGVRSKDIGEKESIEKTKRRFVPPTHDELVTYSQEIGFTNFDADRFLDYYTANGWMVGRQHMKNWKAAVRNWKRQDEGESSSRQRSTISVRTPEWYGKEQKAEKPGSEKTIASIQKLQEEMKGK